jgi:chromosome segregation ATPase
MDQQLSNLKTAKGRADQKYFGMMKYKEQLEAEVATLRKADRTSSGIIASLKNAEAQKNELAISFERQVAEHVDAIERMNQERFGLEAKAREASLAAQGLQKQVLQLKDSLSEKDSALSITESSSREIQREVEALKVKLEDQTKQNAKLKKDAGKNDTEEITNLRVSEMLQQFKSKY